MTVAELIAELQKYPPDMQVLADGHFGYHAAKVYEFEFIRVRSYGSEQVEMFYGQQNDEDTEVLSAPFRALVVS